jgi:8-oxo-dGTP diphosphatase
MKSSVYNLGELKTYKYVVVFARYNNKWILCKHKNRSTWKTSGGHIELGETPLDAAKRELFEETGSIDFNITPICDYWACDEPHETKNITWANGQVFLAFVKDIGKLPESEMECINYFETFPENLTYPDITYELLPCIMDKIGIKSYNKLVRDEIIKIIENNGKQVRYKILNDAEYIIELNKKLLEEVNEFVENNDIEELADVFEVIYTILKVRGVDMKEVENVRIKKKEERGGFKNKIYIKDVME